MRPSPAIVLGATLLSLVQGQSQDLPGLSADVSNLSTFFSLLKSTTDLYSTVEKGDVTILAPTNDALAAAGLTQSNSSGSSQLESLLQYHVLQGVHSKSSLFSKTVFYPSLLQSVSLTNLTGGQVVEATTVNNTDVLFSGLFTKSSITQADISYTNGIIQTIDTVLTIPIQIAQSAVGANLTDFILLSEKAQLGSTLIAPYLSGIQKWPDTTFFAPNSPDYAANFTGYDGLSLAQDLAIWNIHFINGTVLWSSNATNGTTYTTAGGDNITTWFVGDDLYINDAKVIQRDLIQSNGVMQVLDKPLDPNNPDARPAALESQNSNNTSPSGSSGDTSSSTPVTGGLSTGAKAGIAIGVVLLVLAVIAGIAFWLIRKRRRRNTQDQATELDGILVHKSPQNEVEGGERVELGGDKQMHEMRGEEKAHELDAAPQRPVEMEAPLPFSPLVSPISDDSKG